MNEPFYTIDPGPDVPCGAGCVLTAMPVAERVEAQVGWQDVRETERTPYRPGLFTGRKCMVPKRKTRWRKG